MLRSLTKIDFTTFRNVIAGQLRGSERLGRGINPSDRKPLWDVPIASISDLDDAVAAARSAFPNWSRTPWKERQGCLTQARDLLYSYRDDMADLIKLEGGKPTHFAALEVEHALNFLDYHANLGPPEPRIIQEDETFRLTLEYDPIGVVGAICPWNYPLVLAMGKITAALVAGNCIVTKPSPLTPYSLLKFAEMARHVFPPGVLQALHGDDAVGPRICTHPDIQKISFTGSSATGKKVMAAASSTLKSVTLELSGNNASIICPDVDVDVVAPQVAMGSFFNSGQLCIASKRIYVHKDIYQGFLKKLTETVGSWRVGPATSKDSVMLGPLQNEMQYNVVNSFIKDSMEKGYKFALGGDKPLDDSNFVIHPTIIDNPPDDSLVVTGEAFGPVVPVQVWETEDELIARVNDSATGLGGSVWSSDVDRAHRLARRIEAGTVWINSFEKPLPQGHFAGRKESGVGGEWGEQGLLAYCHPRAIHYYKDPVGSKSVI